MQYRALKSPEFLRKTHFQVKILAKIGDKCVYLQDSLSLFFPRGHYPWPPTLPFTCHYSGQEEEEREGGNGGED